jgi:hypothetical protein
MDETDMVLAWHWELFFLLPQQSVQCMQTHVVILGMLDKGGWRVKVSFM